MESPTIDTDGNDSHLKEDMLLRFRVGPFKFSVPAVEVEGIIIPPPLTRIPLNPPHSKGVFMHHGQLTSAISLRSKFGLPDHDDQNLGQLVLGLVSVGMVGLWVDEVYETVDSTELEWRDMPDFIPHEAFDSFAAKGDSVILASTIQKLYDVPAEQVTAMLASVRENYDLPEDVAPVLTESFEAPEQGDGTDESFGELTGGDGEITTTSSTGSAADGTRLGMDGGSEAREETAPQADNDKYSGNSANVSGGSSPRVVDLSSRRAAGSNAVNSARPQSRPDNRGNARSPGDYAAARAARGREDVGISGRSGYRAGSSQPSRGFAGGTYSGSVNRMSSGTPQQNQYARTSAYDTGDSYLSGDTRDSRSSAGLWWILALVLLLLLLLTYWLWPASREQGVVSTMPSQNYQERYRFNEQSTSTTRADTETATTPPVTVEPQEPAPAVAEVSAEPLPLSVQEPASTADPVDNSIGSSDSREIYRLEGEEVTVTVERGSAQSDPEPQAVTKTGDIVPAYNEFVHVVVKGDTLWDIAAKYLKNPFRYPELAQLSRIRNPDLIYPGDVVRIRERNRPQ